MCACVRASHKSGSEYNSYMYGRVPFTSTLLSLIQVINQDGQQRAQGFIEKDLKMRAAGEYNLTNSGKYQRWNVKRGNPYTFIPVASRMKRYKKSNGSEVDLVTYIHNWLKFSSFSGLSRATTRDLSEARLLRSLSPKQAASLVSPLNRASQEHISETGGPQNAPEAEQPQHQRLENMTSPPDSEAYYAETDSDADNITQEKHRRARKKTPRSPPGGSNNKVGEPQDEVSEQSGYDSTPEVVAPGGEGEGLGGVAKREIVFHTENLTDAPVSESEVLLHPFLSEETEAAPEAMLLPHATRTIRAERHLIPMIGPVEHPVDEDLTTSYAEKAKQASRSSAVLFFPY